MTNQYDEIRQAHEVAQENGDYELADFLYGKLRDTCECGDEAWEQHDCHGIYAGKMCDACFSKKFRSSYDEHADGYSAPGEGFFDD